MKAVSALPDGYREYYTVDLKNDKSKMLLVNGIAIVLTVLMVVPMLFAVPIAPLFDMTKGLLAYAVRWGVLIGLMIAYVVLHEAVHGIAMKLCGTKKVKYGFTLVYAFAGSDDYYDKSAYIFIALAPVVLWGAVLAIVNCFVPAEWFWVVYGIQILNISGAAGDFFVTAKFCRFPKDILVKDEGTSMTVYSEM